MGAEGTQETPMLLAFSKWDALQQRSAATAAEALRAFYAGGLWFCVAVR